MNPGWMILLSWLAFFAYWALAAGSVKAAKERPTARGLFLYRLFLVGSFVLLAGLAPVWPLNLQLWPRTFGLAWIGASLAVVGVALAIWARRTLAGNWSSAVTFKEEHELVTTGPYRFARHPIYSGLILMMVGTTLFLGRLDSLLGFVIRAVSYVFKYRREEALMRRHFPGVYPAYEQRVGALFTLPRSGGERKA